jgi:hypothetical protein
MTPSFHWTSQEPTNLVSTMSAQGLAEVPTMPVKKEEIMELYDKEKSIAKVSMLTGVDRSCISRWLKKRFQSPKVYEPTINYEIEKKVIKDFKYFIKQ